jgi:chromosome partitioning protein
MLTIKPPAHIIVLGNEKGGSGKSTTAMHLIVALLREGRSVASFDLDTRQATLSRYLENRSKLRAEGTGSLPMPIHNRPALDDVEGLARLIDQVREQVDAIVIDSPGADTPLSRHAHTLADTLITPLNDSFVDVDGLAIVDPDSLAVIRPSHYAEFVWEQRKRRALQRRPAIDWIVMRNRLSARDTRNKNNVAAVLEALAKRVGFRLAAGFGDRLIFRELFLKGLTLLDMKDESFGAANMSHLAARQEVRALLASLRLPPPSEEPIIDLAQEVVAAPAATAEPEPNPVAPRTLESLLSRARSAA